MLSPISQTLDDRDLDVAAVASSALHSATGSLKPQNSNNCNRFHSPKITFTIISKFTYSSPTSSNTTPRKHSMANGEILQAESSTDQRPTTIARFSLAESTSPPAPLAMVKHVQRTPTTPSSYSSDYLIQSPVNSSSDCSVMTHSLSVDSLPLISSRNIRMLLWRYLHILEKGDYTMISGRLEKDILYFNISYEIKDKTIEFDNSHNVQLAEFIVRTYMKGGRFFDGWGSYDRREKRFLKPNIFQHIPSTVKTRAKNKACQVKSMPETV